MISSPDKHSFLDPEDDFRSGCRNVSHQQHGPFQNYPHPDDHTQYELLILLDSSHLLCLKTYETL